MNQFKRSWLGAWALAFTIVFRILFLLYVYDRFTKIYSANMIGPIGFLEFISHFEKISICVLLAELIVYLLIRNRIYRIQWVRLHVWPVLFAFVLLPLIMMLLRLLASRYTDAESTYAYLADLRRAEYYIFWGSIPVAHAFFIATIAKSFTPKKEPVDEGPPGLLDEFVD
jgi:hypothetical protein